MRKSIMALEGLEETNTSDFMDERDEDFLEHLTLQDSTGIATEGIVKAKIHGIGSIVSDVITESKGWTLGIESKRKYIEKTCDDLIEWLNDENKDYPNLNLDMGSFKTWMKTSPSFFWRYFFILHDETWNKIEKDLKAGEISALETLFNISFKDRSTVTDHLDSVRNIKGLIKVVELYKTRSNKFFELILKRKISIKMAPFQVILLGASDLRRTVKKIVNLAE